MADTRVNSHRSNITVDREVARAIVARAAQLRLSFARLHSILLHNDLEAPPGAELTAITEPDPSATYIKTQLSYRIEASLGQAAKKKAKRLGGNFSTYSEALFRRELESGKDTLTILPIRGSRRPEI